MDTAASPEPLPVIILTGLSGSGKSSALGVFEDMGFFTADGLPAILTRQMVHMVTSNPLPHYCGVVIGMDLRQGDFVDDYEKALVELRNEGYSPRTVFLEARPDILMKRYATTRRPHPLEREGLGLEQALEKERARLSGLRRTADVVIDTSGHSIHDLRRVLQAKWSALRDLKRSMRVHIISFGFKYGTPAEADMVFDIRFLPNPYFIPELKSLSGQEKTVAAFVLDSEPGKTFFQRLADFLEYLLTLNEAEGRFRLTIAIGCTGGRHRSVAVAEALNKRLGETGYTCSLEHRHLDLG